ncbi:helix-turn-helix domain-containing protein [Thermocatellispora tengchongensis]|uniref:helix-turn-helix domain-containing protein n=1 Tax=Thermocatellispora tengchongensis TaxID=1073253 RepID=UPI00362DB2E0
MPGLRREEVAVLAGVSTDWYTRLEKGHINGVSTDVLNAVARALQLDDAERAHLFDLARAAATGPSPRRVRKVRPGLQRMLDAMTDAPAIIRNGRMDIVAANRLGYAMYWPVFHSTSPPPAAARARTPLAPSRPTSRASSSSTRPGRTSSPTGTPPPTSPSPCCAPRPDATPTTRSSPS